jgi:hypothetical protein
MPDWLTQLKTGMAQITLPLAKKYWPGESPEDAPSFNYRLQHVEQVERDASRLMAANGGDEDIVLASVWIHDRYKPQLGGEKHARRAAAWAEQNLAGLGFPAAKVPAVAYAVANHANPPQTIPETAREARILWDADKLGKLGAIFVVYLLYTFQAHPQVKASFTRVRQVLREWESYGSRLVPDLYFPLSRELGQKRYNIFKAFCDALDEETGP